MTNDLRTLEDIEVTEMVLEDGATGDEMDEFKNVDSKALRELVREWKEEVLRLRDKPHNGQTSDFYNGMLAVLDNLHDLEDKDIILSKDFFDLEEEDNE